MSAGTIRGTDDILDDQPTSKRTKYDGDNEGGESSNCSKCGYGGTGNPKVHVDLTTFFTETQFSTVAIRNCNGTGPNPFSRASIDYKKTFSFPSAAWFGDGLISIVKALEGVDTFRGKNTFKNLLDTVFKETKHIECLKSMYKSGTKSEAKVRNTLAAHYFHPLAFGSQFFVDKGSSTCCEYCKKTVPDGDTSFGHPDLWHGRADIMIKNSAVKVTVEPEHSESDEDVAEEPASKNSSAWAKSQAMAEAIVNTFCESKRNKSLSGKFIPSFLATEERITIILYNRDMDILLLSQEFEIWDYKELDKLNIHTMLQVWLALNFEKYEIILDDEKLKNSLCSNFKNVVGEEIYNLYLTVVSKPLNPSTHKIHHGGNEVTPTDLAAVSYIYNLVSKCLENYNTLKQNK